MSNKVESADFEDLEEGDIIMVTFKKMTNINDIKCIFKSITTEELTNKKYFRYYPLSVGGLLNATYIETGSSTGFYRKDPFELSIASVSFVTVLKLGDLFGNEKYIAEDIQALL